MTVAADERSNPTSDLPEDFPARAVAVVLDIQRIFKLPREEAASVPNGTQLRAKMDEVHGQATLSDNESRGLTEGHSRQSLIPVFRI